MRAFAIILAAIPLIKPIRSFTFLAKQTTTKEHVSLGINVATTTSQRFLFNGFFDDDSKIPKEYRKEIYAAEAKTPAAQGRQNRILGYSSFALLFFLLGISNVILTSMKENGVDLDTQGYGWTASIPFLSKGWGGFVDIIAAGLLGTFVELENRTKEDVAEQIWEEFQKRKTEQKPKNKTVSSKKKKKLTKSQKQFAAISEVVVEETMQKPENTQTEEIKNESKEEGGMWNKVKNFYDQADQMAASQALLLNKALEDKGIVDKITDESGLKVIGKDAVEAKRKEKEENA